MSPPSVLPCPLTPPYAAICALFFFLPSSAIHLLCLALRYGMPLYPFAMPFLPSDLSYLLPYLRLACRHVLIPVLHFAQPSLNPSTMCRLSSCPPYLPELGIPNGFRYFGITGGTFRYRNTEYNIGTDTGTE